MNYSYIAKDMKTGKRVKSIVAAETISSLVKELHRNELLPLKIIEAGSVDQIAKLKSFWPHSQRKIKSKEIAIFTRQLSATIKAGLLLSDALETIADDLDNLYFQEVIQKVREQVSGGRSFSEALKVFPAVFSRSYISVITTGEVTGRMDMTLESLAKFLENTESIRKKVSGSLQYPLFILGFACLIVFCMFIFIIPKFKEIFIQSGAPLPGFTQVVIGYSDFIIHQWLFLTTAVIVVGVLIKQSFKIPHVVRRVDQLSLKLPIVGKEILHKFYISCFCRTLGFMLSSGVGLPKILEIAAQVIRNCIFVESIQTIRKKILSGTTFSDALREQKIFPKLVTKMCSIGEKTGNLDHMMTQTADYYAEELESSIHKLTTLIEPTLIVFVGIIVGIVIVAIYLPIFKFSLLVK